MQKCRELSRRYLYSFTVIIPSLVHAIRREEIKLLANLSEKLQIYLNQSYQNCVKCLNLRFSLETRKCLK
jgi:transcription initiation factor IIE alpha subunit